MLWRWCRAIAHINSVDYTCIELHRLQLLVHACVLPVRAHPHHCYPRLDLVAHCVWNSLVLLCLDRCAQEASVQVATLHLSTSKLSQSFIGGNIKPSACSLLENMPAR